MKHVVYYELPARDEHYKQPNINSIIGLLVSFCNIRIVFVEKIFQQHGERQTVS